MTQLLDDSVIVDCSGRNCTARLAMTRDELRAVVDRGDSVRCPGCERKAKEGARKQERRGLTKFELIVLAAHDLETAGEGSDLDINDLIVAAWSLDRTRLGLRKYERQYPDAKNVEVSVTHMVNTYGLFARTRPCHVALTEAGRAPAAKLDATRTRRA